MGLRSLGPPGLGWHIVAGSMKMGGEMDNTMDESTANTASTASTEGSGAQSVDRAVTVLEYIARRRDASVSEVAEAVGVHRSTISRLLAVLELRGMVEIAGTRGRYRLGMNILRLAGAMQATLDVTTQGAPVCVELASRLGETVNIAIAQGGHAVNVYQAEGKGAITVDSWVGRPTPMHATSSGKVLLAWLPAVESDAILRGPLGARTPATVTDPDVLRGQLSLARSDGFSLSLGELEEGLNAIAAPIRGQGDVVLGALSVSGPGYRWLPELMREHAGEIITAADRVSERMGYLG